MQFVKVLYFVLLLRFLTGKNAVDNWRESDVEGLSVHAHITVKLFQLFLQFETYFLLRQTWRLFIGPYVLVRDSSSLSSLLMAKLAAGSWCLLGVVCNFISLHQHFLRFDFLFGNISQSCTSSSYTDMTEPDRKDDFVHRFYLTCFAWKMHQTNTNKHCKYEFSTGDFTIDKLSHILDLVSEYFTVMKVYINL